MSSSQNPFNSSDRSNQPEVTITDAAVRAFEMSIDIAADPEAVWNALTDAAELVRWFPFEARVDPRTGGTMFWGWGEAWDWKHRIDEWDPPRRLRLVDDRYVPFDVHGQPMSGGAVRPAAVAIEITIEGARGAQAPACRVRLVHSGFERGAAWDAEFEGISTGWQAELRNLRYYLERFRGRDRHAAMARLSTSESRGAAWRRVLADGFALDTPSMTEGAGYSARTPGGRRLAGTILMTLPDREFSGSLDDMDGGVFRVATHTAGGQTGVVVWFSSYRAGDASRVEELRAEAQAAIERLFEPTRAR